MPLIRLFLDICLLRRGPQDLPASGLLLGLALLANLVVSVVLLGLETDWTDAVIQALVGGAMLLGFLFITLKAAGLTPRFLQTSIAMLGSDALISSFAVPLLAMMVLASPDEKSADFFLLILKIVFLMLMLWYVAVMAHILRHALSRPLGIAVALALVYVLASVQIMSMLFAPPA
jgi:hypothetical protein